MSKAKLCQFLQIGHMMDDGAITREMAQAVIQMEYFRKRDEFELIRMQEAMKLWKLGQNFHPSRRPTILSTSYESYLASIPDIPKRFREPEDRPHYLVLVDPRIRISEILRMMEFADFKRMQGLPKSPQQDGPVHDIDSRLRDAAYWMRCYEHSTSGTRDEIMSSLAPGMAMLTLMEGLSFMAHLYPKIIASRSAFLGTIFWDATAPHVSLASEERHSIVLYHQPDARPILTYQRVDDKTSFEQVPLRLI